VLACGGSLTPCALQVAWITCGGYVASQLIMAAVRGTHYFSMDPQHHVWQLGRVLGVRYMFALWWTWVAIWPLPALFIAFAAGGSRTLCWAHATASAA
jgi:hypothetical protein